MINIGIVGAQGRMGKTLIIQLQQRKDLKLAAATENPDKSDAIGKDIGLLLSMEPLNIALLGDAATMFQTCDVVIDFSHPSLIANHCALAVAHKTALIIGTTGLGAAEHAHIDAASMHIGIVQAGNMSLGVNILLGLSQKLAHILPAQDWDIEVLEMHHKHKIDAPSGTALMLGEAAAKGRNVHLSDHQILSREGQTGARQQGDIGFATLRGGSVVGDHQVIFAGEGELIALEHKAQGREIFAKGALAAAAWIYEKPAGRYSMQDVLGLAD